MMKPKIEDVVEYVRDGEKDTEMKTFLEAHPDGAEILKQARFIVRMLKRGAEDSAGMGMVADSAATDVLMESPSDYSLFPEFSDEPPRNRLIKAKRSVEKGIYTSARRTEHLGTLAFVVVGDPVELSYVPSKPVLRRTSKLEPELRAGKPGVGGIEIHGDGVVLSLPDAAPAGSKVPLRVSRGPRRMPLVRQEMIFLPDSGPFVRLETDDTGELELPVPERPGTLRIDADKTHVLRVEIKK